MNHSSFNTALMEDVVQLYNQFEQVKSYDDLNQTEQEAINEISEQLDRLHDSAKSREVLSEIRWDRIADNAHGMTGEIEDTVGLPSEYTNKQIPDDEYANMVYAIENHVDSIVESLQQIEELASELNEHTA